MFTGIVEEIGTIESVKSAKNLALVTVKAKKILSGSKLGDSIAIDGVCLTVVNKASSAVCFEAMKETLDKTTAGIWRKGMRVNLERALLANSRLGGHFVTGHVDGIGVITGIAKEENYVALALKSPKELMKFIVPKGSICLNGVSLTVGKVRENNFEVYLIPYTLKETNLGLLKLGDPVNIEIDILARYMLKK